jgi:hypothetical protein
VDKAWAHRMLLLRAGDTLTGNAAHRLAEVFTADDPTGKLEAVWKVKEQLRILLRTSSLADAAAAKEDLKVLVEANNTGIKHIKRTARGYRNPGNYKSHILMRSVVRTAA